MPVLHELVVVRQFLIPIFRQGQTVPVEVAFQEQFKHLGRLPYHGHLNGIGVKPVPEKALLVRPPTRHAGERDGFAGLHIICFHLISAQCRFKFELKILHILFVQLAIKMFRHRPQAGDLFNNIRLGLIKTNRKRLLIIDRHVFKFLITEIVIIPWRLNVFTAHHVETKEEVRHFERLAIRITRIRIDPEKHRAPVWPIGPFLGQARIIPIAIRVRHHQIHRVVIEHITPKRPIGVRPHKPKCARVVRRVFHECASPLGLGTGKLLQLSSRHPFQSRRQIAGLSHCETIGIGLVKLHHIWRALQRHGAAHGWRGHNRPRLTRSSIGQRHVLPLQFRGKFLRKNLRHLPHMIFTHRRSRRRFVVACGGRFL